MLHLTCLLVGAFISDQTADLARLRTASDQNKAELLETADVYLRVRTAEAKQGRIGKKNYQDDVARLGKIRKIALSSDIVLPVLNANMVPGQIGYLSGGWRSDQKTSVGRYCVFKVLQITSPSEMLIEGREEFVHTVTRRPTGNQRRFKVTGIDTSNFSDGKLIVLNQIMEVVKHQPYATANGGSKTVFLLRPFAIQNPDNESVIADDSPLGKPRTKTQAK